MNDYIQKLEEENLRLRSLLDSIGLVKEVSFGVGTVTTLGPEDERDIKDIALESLASKASDWLYDAVVNGDIGNIDLTKYPTSVTLNFWIGLKSKEKP